MPLSFRVDPVPRENADARLSASGKRRNAALPFRKLVTTHESPLALQGAHSSAFSREI